MTARRSLAAIPTLLLTLALAACTAAAPPPSADTAPPTAAGHGAVAGAAQVAEPPLALLSVAADGRAGVLDLLDGTAAELGRIAPPTAVASDGRFGFFSTEQGVAVIDSGRWTWDHVDHFHYYLAEPRIVGTLPGAGPATVATGMLATAGGTGVFFAGSGEAVLLDNAALADGRITERFRIATDTGAGLIAPLGDGAVVADGHEIVRYSAAGAMQGTATPCTAPAGAITTRVALVIGCAEGAVFATAPGAGAATGTDAAAGTDATAGTDADAGTDAGTDTDPGAVPATTVPGFETVPYPAGGGADRALSLDGRKGRPTVAGRTGGPGFWLLDTRARAWQFVPTTAVLERVVAVDDEAGHVVALDRDGRVRVFVAETGAEVGTTEPLVPTITDAVSLTVDSQRAYVNDPAGGVVHEIAYSGEARLARTLDTATTPDLIAEVGR